MKEYGLSLKENSTQIGVLTFKLPTSTKHML